MFEGFRKLLAIMRSARSRRGPRQPARPPGDEDENNLGGAGVGAKLPPTVPTLSGAAAKPFPPED